MRDLTSMRERLRDYPRDQILIGNGGAVILSRQETIVFDALRQARGTKRGLNSTALSALVYSDRDRPKSAQVRLHKLVRKLRAKIELFDLQIAGKIGGQGGYWLVDGVGR